MIRKLGKLIFLLSYAHKTTISTKNDIDIEKIKQLNSDKIVCNRHSLQYYPQLYDVLKPLIMD